MKGEVIMTTVLFKQDSDNRKIGHIAMSYTERGTCPDACSLKDNGCYADGYPVAFHWGAIGDPERRKKTHFDWDDFCLQVQALPRNKMFRHNVAGDLPGENNSIDRDKLDKLVDAASRINGFTFSHKPVGMGVDDTPAEQLTRAQNGQAIKSANANGFTINLSADNLQEADRLADLNIGPVVVVVGMDAPKQMKTDDGRHVVVCINEDNKNITCEHCGLCAISDRKAIVAFRVHGFRRHKIDKRLREETYLNVIS